MPFITEEIWQNLKEAAGGGTGDRGPGAGDSIMVQQWPHIQKQMINKTIDSQMQILIDIIVAIRNIRSSWNINPSVKVNIFIKAAKNAIPLVKDNQIYIKNLAKVERIEISETLKTPPRSAVAVIRDVEVYIPLEEFIDTEGERERLIKKVEEITNIMRGIDGKLKNREFLKKAPPEIIKNEKNRKTELSDTLGRLKTNLKDLE